MASQAPAFLNETLPGETGHLAVFGKHPTAADHLEDIGLVTESLVAFKKGFYVEGIGECLTKQAWVKDLGVTESIPYDHCLLSVGQGGWLAVRFLHSSDAPGRKQFPLVLALHGRDFSALNRIADIGQMLESHIGYIAAAKEPTALHQLQVQAQEQIQELMKAGSESQSPGVAAKESWIQSLGLGAEYQGLWRVCHALSPKGAGAGRARVPVHLGGPWQSGTLWLSFARHLLGSQSAVLTLLWRQRQGFADLFLSAPSARVLATLFATEACQPLTASVPFNISPELKTESETAFHEWLQQAALFSVPEFAKDSPSLLNKVCNGWRALFKSAS